MTDNEKRAHDIAVSLLPKSLESTSSELYDFDSKGNGELNSSEILDAYYELYYSILKEINSR